MRRLSTPCLLLLLVLAFVGLSDAFASDEQGETRERPRNRWQPPEQDRSAYRDIVDFNIFRSDRKRIADQVDRDRNPPKPRDPEPRETIQVVEKPPPNPDSFLRLTGIGHDPEGAVAFVEHLETGELSRLTGPTEFSQGEVTEIGYRSVMYVVDDERRLIHVGETFVGERKLPSGASIPGAGTSGSGSTSNLSPAERLKLLREKRARELGTAPPSDTAETTDEPQANEGAEEAAEPSPDREGDADQDQGVTTEATSSSADPGVDANKP